MKKNLILPAFFIVFVVTWFSCQKNGITLNKQSTTDALESADIGAWHNKVLSEVLTTNSLKTNSSTTNNTENYFELRERIIQILIKDDPKTFVKVILEKMLQFSTNSV